jgi:hypothetical protein
MAWEKSPSVRTNLGGRLKRLLRFEIRADNGRISALFLKNICLWRMHSGPHTLQFTAKLEGLLEARFLEDAISTSIQPIGS